MSDEGIRKAYPVVTICGSMRYYNYMLELARNLTLTEHIVLMPFVIMGGNYMIKDMLDDMHLAKIDMSSVVYIVGNHIGTSTTQEIEYAVQNSKKVIYMSVHDISGGHGG